MASYRVKTLLDITQPLLNHDYTNKIPSILKAVVEVTEDSHTNPEDPKQKISIVYIETEGKEIGKGTIFQYIPNNANIIPLSKTKITKQTQYKIDRDLITALLSKTQISKK